ncbi:T9SS type A sorting domain-containing protein [Pedobacter sp. UBA5917]|uniref:T9SS type A sorting domain-containing protein n=1 Tax=Pedobacter sp. UBA5917 TaxID=1947061 RepID=UPI0025EAAD01|nr:T9SS type A sorting domain-containing protein [Pedobacter sp. UBA5917]
MKKVFLLLSISFLFLFKSYGQATLTRSVAASTGSSAQVGATLVQFTVGEVATLTLQSAGIMLTQGFQQPEIIASNFVPNAVGNMRVYPNPAVGKTKVDFDLLTDGKVIINLVNNAGQIVHSSSVTSLAGKIEYVIPLNGLASGMYHVVLYVNYRTFSEKLVIQ